MALKRTSLDGNELRMEVLQNGSEWRNLASSSRVRSAMESSWSFFTVFGGNCPALELAKFCFEN